MAFFFGTGTQSISLADNAALDLPNGEWAIALRGQETSRATSSRLYSRNMSDSANFLVCLLGTGGDVNSLFIDIADGGGNARSFVADASAITSGNPFTLIIARGSDNFVRAYINDALAGTSAATLTTAIDSSEALWIGNRDDSTRPFNGWIADYAQWNRALTADERTAYNKAFAAPFFPGRSLYLPMIRDAVELVARTAVTASGTTVVPHPPIIYPTRPYIIQAPVSAGVTHEFAGSETVSFDGTAAMVQTATFTDSQAVSFDGTAAMVQTAAMTGAETVSFDGSIGTVQIEHHFEGAETVSFDGTADTVLNHWLMDGTQTVSFDGSAALKQTATLSGAETVSFDGTAALDIAAIAFAGQGVLSFDGSIATVNAILQMEAAQSVSFDGQAALGQQATFEGGATLSFDGLANLLVFEWEDAESATEIIWSDID